MTNTCQPTCDPAQEPNYSPQAVSVASEAEQTYVPPASTEIKQPTPTPQRVISLLGAATETLYRLGLGHLLVGRSHECDYPPQVLSLPCISRPRLDVDAPSNEIDAAVRQRSAAGEPIYKLDDAVLAQIAPFDLLIAQDHCRVCAVTPTDVNQSNVKACANVKQLVLKPATLQDCLDDVSLIADAMGVSERGVALRTTLEERLDRVKQITNFTSSTSTGTGNNRPRPRPRVALLEWCDPIMGCGYWIPELIHAAGGEALHCPPPGGSTPTISFQTLLDSKPDVVIFALCGFGLSRAAAEIVSSRDWSDDGDASNLQRLKRACGGKMFVVDGNYLVNRSGPRVVESCEALAEAMHEDLRGHFGHFGTELLTTFDEAVKMAKAGVRTGSSKLRPEPFEEKVESKLNLNNEKIGNGNGNGNGNDKATAVMSMSMPKEGPDEVVVKQLRHLESGNIEAAFALNSSANQDRWCGAERFAAVLRSHNDFRRLLEESADVGDTEVKNDVATVRVSLPMLKKSEQDKRSEQGDKERQEGNSSDGVNLIFTMVAEIPFESDAIQWRTEKVGIVSS